MHLELFNIVHAIRRNPYFNQYKNNRYMWTLDPPRSCKIIINNMVIRVPDLSMIRIHPNKDLLVLQLTVDIDYSLGLTQYNLPWDDLKNFKIVFEQKARGW